MAYNDSNLHKENAVFSGVDLLEGGTRTSGYVSRFERVAARVGVKLDAAQFQLYNADNKFLDSGINLQFKYIDTHCHLDLLMSRSEHKNCCDFDKFILCCKHWSPNFAGCIADFCFPEFLTGDNFAIWNKIAKSNKVWLAIGVHPHAAHLYDDLCLAIQDKLDNDARKIVAIGEMGLDYSSNNTVEHDLQKETLKKQLRLAIKYKKPILLHCRDAAEDCYKIFLQIVPCEHKIHWHCYSESFETYQKWTDYFQNIYFGVTLGIYSPRSNQETFWKVSSIERLVIETDSPYFLPQRFRSKALGSMRQCHPGLGALVAFKLAEYKGESVEKVMTQTFKNTLKLYDICVLW